MKLRHLIHLIWVPVLLLGLLAPVYYLAYTESGMAVVASALNRRLGPVTIQLRGVSGTLARGVHVDLLVFDHRRVHIEVEDADGRLAILPLAWRTVRVPELHMGRLLVHALPRSGELAEWSPHFLPPLMHIDAEHVDARRWQLITINGDEYDGSSVAAAGTVYPHIVHLYSGSFEYNGVHARTIGEMHASQPIGLRGTLHFDAEPPGQPAWTVNARIDGDLARLALDADVTDPFAAAFHGDIRDLTSHWRWRGQAQVRHFELAAWNAGNGLGVITASLAMEGDHDGFRAQGSVDPPGLHAGSLDADFSGSYKARVLTVARLRLRHAASGAIADAQGSVTVVAGGPLLDLRGERTQVRWPLAAAEAPIHSARGNYTLQGLRPYAIGAQGEVRAGELPPLQVALRGRFAPGAFTADSADVEALGAHSQLS